MTLTDLEASFLAAAKFFRPTDTGPPPERFSTPGDLATRLDARTRQTPALQLIDQALMGLVDEPDGRLIISMPPQEGKSDRVTRRFVTWVLRDAPDTRVAVVAHEHKLARRMGRTVRDDIVTHRSLGLTIRQDLSSQSEWQLKGALGGVYAVGIGGSLTGRPVDLMVIDDPVKDRRQADSEAHRESVWAWWTDVGSARLAPGAPVVLVLTRWHEDDLAGRLLAAEDGHRWRVLNIPAQADHDPAQGETDVLGREPGQFMESARGRSREQWEQRKVAAGSRTWASLYQGRPSPAEGGIFKRGWWRFYDTPQWLERGDGSRVCTSYDELMLSWDMTFKDTAGTDYVCGGVLMRRGADSFLLDLVYDRMDFVRTLREFQQLAARWPQAVLKLVEDKANGPAVISMLGRKVPGIVPEEPQGSKVARASAVSPLAEAGNVWLPDPSLAPWVGAFVEQCAAFPNAAHDDMVDMLSQGLNRMVLQPLLAGEDLGAEDLDQELAAYSISPY